LSDQTQPPPNYKAATTPGATGRPEAQKVDGKEVPPTYEQAVASEPAASSVSRPTTPQASAAQEKPAVPPRPETSTASRPTSADTKPAKEKPSLTQKPTASTTPRPAAPDAKVNNFQAFQTSIRTTVLNFFGRSPEVKVNTPKAASRPAVVPINVRTPDGREINLKLQNSAIDAYLKKNGIPRSDFKPHAYLADVLKRHDPMRPGEVQTNGINSIADLNGMITDLEIPMDTNKRLFGTA